MAVLAAESTRLLLIDSDVLTLWRNGHAAMLARINAYVAHHKQPPLLPAVVVFEAYFGIETARVKGRSEDETNRYRMALDAFLADLDTVPFDEDAARLAGLLLARLSRAERGRLWRDALIAATAAAHGFGLATRNRADFELLGGLLPADANPLRVAIWKP